MAPGASTSRPPGRQVTPAPSAEEARRLVASRYATEGVPSKMRGDKRLPVLHICHAWLQTNDGIPGPGHGMHGMHAWHA